MPKSSKYNRYELFNAYVDANKHSHKTLGEVIKDLYGDFKLPEEEQTWFKNKLKINAI